MEEMNTYSQFITENKDAKGHGSEKHAVMAFGRMNPPTAGHEEVVKKMHDVAKEHGAEHHLVLSHSEDKKKNPLPVDKKVAHAKNAFPGTNVRGASKDKPTILHHAADLHKSGVQHLHVVAGSDRHQAMHDLLHKYNDGKEHAHGSFKFKSITLHSSGERDPDSEGTAGVSGTKMREHASSGNKKDFHANLPKSMKPEHKDALYHDLRHHMGIKEEMKTYKELIEGDSYISKLISRHRSGERLASTEHELVKAHLKRSKIYNKSKNAISSEFREEQINEVSSELLSRYKEGAKKSADELTAKGQHKKAGDRWLNVMKATGKQIEKTTAGIKKALHKEETKEQGADRTKQLRNFKQMILDLQLQEVLSKDASAGDWIHDFVHSDNPKFAGKSKEKRKQMALAAYYAKQRNEEVEHIEEASYKGDGKVETKKYSWGTMKTVHHGHDFSVPLHPEHHQAIHALKDNQEHKFKDETGRHWTAKRMGDDVHLHSANNGPKTKIKHSDLKEEQIDELSRDTLLSYANKVSLDSQKHSKDPTKRSGEKASRSVTGYARAHNRLEKPVKEGVMQPSGTDKIETSGSPVSDIGTQNLKVKKVKSFKFFTTEEAKTGNPGFGYHGQHKSENDADKAYAKIHAHVKSLTDGDDKTVKHYLDSAHGRHLVGHEEDHEHIKKDFKKFKKHYRPEMHEEVELSEAGGVGDSLGHLTAAERAREIARRKAKIASNTTPANKKFVEKALSGKPVKEEAELTDEQIIAELNSLTEEDLQGLTVEQLEALAEAVRVYDISKSNQGTKPKTPEERNKAAAAVKAARANKPKDNYSGKSVTGAGSVGAGARQAGKKPSHIAVKEEHVEEGVFKGTAEVVKQAVRVPYRAVKRVAGAVLDTAHDVGDAAKNIKKKFKEEVDLTEGMDPSEVAGNPRMYSADTAKKAYYHKNASASDKESLARHLDRHHGNKEWRKPVKEEAELDEAFINGREYASHGLMHPDHAPMHKVGDSRDFYAHGSGDKLSGKVTKNDGKEVHIQADKTSGGKLHKFKVQRDLPKQQNEAVKPINIDKVNIAGDKPHEEKWEPAKKKMKKESVSFSDFLKQLDEKLIGKQKNIDKNKNGKLDKQDFEMLRKEETEALDEIKMADLPSRTVKGRSYGADYEDPEGAFETKADMKKAEPKKAGRKVGQKVGARANLGNSKLHRA